MIIQLIPQRRNDQLALKVEGDAVYINGELFDFSKLNEGDELPAEAIQSELVPLPVSRVEGKIRISIILPHGPTPSDAARFPSPIEVDQDGDVELPQ